MNYSHCYLFREEHIPKKAGFPVIDAHNHLWGDWTKLDDLVHVLDQVGVICYCDLTANVSVSWGDGGYVLGQGDIQEFFANCVHRFP